MLLVVLLIGGAAPTEVYRRQRQTIFTSPLGVVLTSVTFLAIGFVLAWIPDRMTTTTTGAVQITTETFGPTAPLPPPLRFL